MDDGPVRTVGTIFSRPSVRAIEARGLFIGHSDQLHLALRVCPSSPLRVCGEELEDQVGRIDRLGGGADPDVGARPRVAPTDHGVQLHLGTGPARRVDVALDVATDGGDLRLDAAPVEPPAPRCAPSPTASTPKPFLRPVVAAGTPRRSPPCSGLVARRASLGQSTSCSTAAALTGIRCSWTRMLRGLAQRTYASSGNGRQHGSVISELPN